MPQSLRTHRTFRSLALLPMLLLAPLCLVSALIPSPARAGLKEQVFETQLPNGLKIILLENHRAPIVTFQVWYRAGSRNEAWGKTGLAHVLEHMMFKGTQRISSEAFIQSVQERGGEYNAFTSHDFAGYFETLNVEHVQTVIDLEADRMRNLILRPEDFHTERMVVMEERRMRTDDNPQAVLMEQLDATAFQTQPYHWPIVGWMSDLARLSPEDARAFYRTYYTPSNAFIVAVGDFNREDLLEKIRKAFGTIAEEGKPEHMRFNDPPQEGERRLVVERPAQLAALLAGYHAPNLQNPDSFALAVIAAILSEGKSARLYERLVREKHLVLEANAQYTPVTVDPSLFYIAATPLPGKAVDEVEKAIDEELLRLQQEPVGERELEKAKNQIEASFLFQQDSLFMQAMLLAQFEIALDWRALDDWIPSIRRVSAEDIQRSARSTLTARNRTLGVLRPLPAAQPPAAAPGAPTKERFIQNREPDPREPDRSPAAE